MNRPNRCRTTLAGLATAATLSAFSLSAPATAQILPPSTHDGVVLITQEMAMSGNVTPGDGPGFPITITQPGSYRLAGNLTVDNLLSRAIEIQATGVSLDLNGFVVRGARCGPSRCTINPPDVPGIYSTKDDLRIHNGTVENFPGAGIRLGSGTLESLVVRDNGSDGISVHGSGLVSRVRASRNRRGVMMQAGRIEHSMLQFNTLSQLQVLNGIGTVSGNLLLGPAPMGESGTRLPMSANDNLCGPAIYNASRC